MGTEGMTYYQLQIKRNKPFANRTAPRNQAVNQIRIKTEYGEYGEYGWIAVSRYSPDSVYMNIPFGDSDVNRDVHRAIQFTFASKRHRRIRIVFTANDSHRKWIKTTSPRGTSYSPSTIRMWWTSKRRRPIRITRMRIAFTYIVFECYGPHGDANLIHLRHALLYSNTQQVNAIRITCSYHIQLHTPSRLYSNGIHIGQRGNMRMWCASVNANAMSIHVFEWHSGQHIHITFTSDEHRLHTPAIRIKTEYGIHIWFESLVRISDSNQNRIPYSHLIRIAYSHFRFESKPNTIFTSDSHRVFAFQIRIKTEYRIHMWFASRIRMSDSNQNQAPYSHVIRIHGICLHLQCQ